MGDLCQKTQQLLHAQLSLCVVMKHPQPCVGALTALAATIQKKLLQICVAKGANATLTLETAMQPRMGNSNVEQLPALRVQFAVKQDIQRRLHCVEVKIAPAVTIQLQRLQISVEKALSAMCSQDTAMQDKKIDS